MCTRSGSKVRSRFSQRPVAPSGLIWLGGRAGITRGKPWAMFSCPFGAELSVRITDAKRIQTLRLSHLGFEPYGGLAEQDTKSPPQIPLAFRRSPGRCNRHRCELCVWYPAD